MLPDRMLPNRDSRSEVEKLPAHSANPAGLQTREFLGLGVLSKSRATEKGRLG
jgi:hypothetical protein